MKKYFYITILCTFLMLGHEAVLAAETAAPALRPSLILVREADCQWLVRHRPDDDVAYRPGVGVDGRPVAPADVTPPPDTGFKIVSFDLLRRPVTGRDLLVEGRVGEIAVDVDSGEVTLNGQPLAPRVHRAVVAYCAGRETGPRR